MASNKHWLYALMLCGAGLTEVHAADPVTEASIRVDASIVAGCLIKNTEAGGLESNLNGRTGIDWGDINFPESAAAGSASNVDSSLVWSQFVTVACTPDISLQMSIDAGDHVSSGGVRRLQHTADDTRTLEYYLYTSSARDASSEIPINTAVDITDTISDYENIVFPIYARLMLPEVAASGTYTDTIRVTLAW